MVFMQVQTLILGLFRAIAFIRQDLRLQRQMLQQFTSAIQVVVILYQVIILVVKRQVVEQMVHHLL